MIHNLKKEKDNIKAGKPVQGSPDLAGYIKQVDRAGDWKEFSSHMEDYLDEPRSKYGETSQKFDLMPLTPIDVCVWNILKYALRNYLGHGKGRDFEKVAHYAQMAWTKTRRGEG